MGNLDKRQFRGWEAYKGYGNACGEVNNWDPVDGPKILQVLQKGWDTLASPAEKGRTPPHCHPSPTGKSQRDTSAVAQEQDQAHTSYTSIKYTLHTQYTQCT